MATEKNITMKQFNGTDYDTLYPKTIASQVDGILLAQILVTTLPNTEVTASLNGKTVSATSDSSGLAILKIPDYGTWTVSVTGFGTTTSKNYEIKAVAQYELALFPSPELENTSWDFIDSISKSGIAASVWSVGDKKTVAIDGVNYQVQIIGFDHDTLTTADGSRTKAGITFQLVDCLNTTYSMNGSDTNVNGWRGSTMRTSTMATLLNQLSSDLKSVLKFVNKVTSQGNNQSGLETTSDKLFLLSENEVFGATQHSYTGEGKQYEYYTAGNSTIKKVNGSANGWWERSPYRGSTNDFCSTRSDGDANYYNASYSRGVAFAFCV